MRIPTGHFRKNFGNKRKKNCAVPIRCGAHTICGTKNGEYVLSARRAYQEAARHFLITANSVSTVTNHPKKTERKKRMDCWNEVTDDSFFRAWLIERRASRSAVCLEMQYWSSN